MTPDVRRVIEINWRSPMATDVSRLEKTLRLFRPMAVMLLFLATGFVVFQTLFPAHAAEGAGMDEHKLKAALVFNFPKFIEWPPDAYGSPGAPIRMCILGTDPLAEELMALNAKKIGERPLIVTMAREVDAAKSCHIVFIGDSERKNIEAVLNALNGRSILTIGDMDQFVEAGGVIELIEVQDKIRFEVNLAAARRAKLEISSKLLKLADKVIENY